MSRITMYLVIIVLSTALVVISIQLWNLTDAHDVVVSVQRDLIQRVTSIEICITQNPPPSFCDLLPVMGTGR